MKSYFTSRVFLVASFVTLSSCVANRSFDFRTRVAPPAPTPPPALERTPLPGGIDDQVEAPTVGTLFVAEESGQKRFQVIFSYAGTLKYDLTYKTSIKDEDLNKLPEKIRYAFYEDSLADFISEWVEVSRNTLREGKITLTDQKVLAKLIPHQSSVDLFFAVFEGNKSIPKFTLPIASLCEQFETKYFKNETDPAKNCVTLTEADVKAKAPDAFK